MTRFIIGYWMNSCIAVCIDFFRLSYSLLCEIMKPCTVNFAFIAAFGEKSCGGDQRNTRRNLFSSVFRLRAELRDMASSYVLQLSAWFNTSVSTSSLESELFLLLYHGFMEFTRYSLKLRLDALVLNYTNNYDGFSYHTRFLCMSVICANDCSVVLIHR